MSKSVTIFQHSEKKSEKRMKSLERASAGQLPPFRETERDLGILEAVDEYGVLTARQIARLFFPPSASAMLRKRNIEKEKAQELAIKVYRCLGCEGMARVDLFLEKATGDFWANEVNTIPGFTSISMYPALWQKSGKSYGGLLDELIALAFARHERVSQLISTFAASGTV